MKKALIIVTVFAGSVAAYADILIDQQPTNYGNGREGDTSDYFSDLPDLSTYGFDDFALSSSVTLTSITAYGVELGVPSGTAHLRIQQNHNHTDPGTVFVNVMQTGGEVGGDWTFNGLNGMALNAGLYWMEVWIDRTYSTQGQWMWANSSVNPGPPPFGVRGSESWLHIPGWLNHPYPLPASQTGLHGPRDNAFTIYGVPEPAALPALTSGLAVLMARRRTKSS